MSQASSRIQERLCVFPQFVAGVGQVTVAVWLAGCVVYVTATICTALVTCTHSTVHQSLILRISKVRTEGVQETQVQKGLVTVELFVVAAESLLTRRMTRVEGLCCVNCLV